MDDTYENMPCLGLNRRRTCTLSRFDDVGAEARYLKVAFTAEQKVFLDEILVNP